MVETLKRKLFPKLYADLIHQAGKQNERTLELDARERQIENAVNQRVATALLRIDPFKPLLDRYGGVFGEDFQRPEDKLNEQSKMQMFMWGYAQMRDPSFLHFIQWVLNTEGNAAIRKGNPNTDTILFSRAMIAAPMLLRREVERLSSRYEEIMEERSAGGFDPTRTVE